MPDQYQDNEQDRRLSSIEQSIKIINGEVGALAQMFSDTKGEIKVDIEKMRGELCARLTKIEGKLTWYMWLVPILTSVIGFLSFKAF